MFSTDDTIVAIATPPGRGAIGIVRLSGPDAAAIARTLTSRTNPFRPRHATLARIVAGRVRDSVVVTWFPKPASYTGDDVIEISAHGSGVVLRGLVAAALDAGARLAAPGEFTLRAFLNGKIDLAQAEAVADLIDAVTPLQARAAFDQLSGTLSDKVARIDERLFDLAARLEASVDFPDEGFHFIEADAVASALDGIGDEIDAVLTSAWRGRLVRDGAQVVIVGRPNVGKSSLFNALVGSHRAIVTDIAGTTRDLVTEVVDLQGVRVTLVDTAGLADARDPVEREGIARSRQAIQIADLVLLVFDTLDAWKDARDVVDVIGSARVVCVVSKSDLAKSEVDARGAWWPAGSVRVSSVTGEGLSVLVDRIVHELTSGEPVDETPAVSNLRHIDLLERTRAILTSASASIRERGQEQSEEFVLADLQTARRLLESVTGRRSADDTLIHIFERFCVGK